MDQIAARLLQYEQARAYYLKVQDFSLEDEARRLHALGTVESRLGQEQEALCRFQESLIIEELIYGKEHPCVVEIRKNVIAATYQTIEHPQQKIAFILAEYSRQTGLA